MFCRGFSAATRHSGRREATIRNPDNVPAKAGNQIPNNLIEFLLDTGSRPPQADSSGMTLRGLSRLVLKPTSPPCLSRACRGVVSCRLTPCSMPYALCSMPYVLCEYSLTKLSHIAIDLDV